MRIPELWNLILILFGMQSKPLLFQEDSPRSSNPFLRFFFFFPSSSSFFKHLLFSNLRIDRREWRSKRKNQRAESNEGSHCVRELGRICAKALFRELRPGCKWSPGSGSQAPLNSRYLTRFEGRRLDGGEEGRARGRGSVIEWVRVEALAGDYRWWNQRLSCYPVNVINFRLLRMFALPRFDKGSSRKDNSVRFVCRGGCLDLSIDGWSNWVYFGWSTTC